MILDLIKLVFVEAVLLIAPDYAHYSDFRPFGNGEKIEVSWSWPYPKWRAESYYRLNDSRGSGQ